MHVERTKVNSTQNQEFDRKKEERVKKVVSVQPAFLDKDKEKVNQIKNDRGNGEIHVIDQLFQILLLEGSFNATFGNENGQSQQVLGARVEDNVHDGQVQVQAESVRDFGLRERLYSRSKGPPGRPKSTGCWSCSRR